MLKKRAPRMTMAGRKPPISPRSSATKKRTPKAKKLESHTPLNARPEQERVLFIDQSTTHCGIAIGLFTPNQTPRMCVAFHGRIIPDKKNHICERVAFVIAAVENLLTGSPAFDAVCIEDLRFGGARTKGSTATDEAMAAVSFAILTLCHRLKLPMYRQAPSRIKAAFTGSGKATKDDMVEMACRRLNKSITDDNEADAIGAAYSWDIHREDITKPKVKKPRKMKPLF